MTRILGTIAFLSFGSNYKWFLSSFPSADTILLLPLVLDKEKILREQTEEQHICGLS